MTNQEAIKGLKRLRHEFSGYRPNEEMIDLAIEALEQEPCVDAISRSEFEKRIKHYDTEDEVDKALYNFAHNILIGCPSVKVSKDINVITAEDTVSRKTVIQIIEAHSGYMSKNMGYEMRETIKALPSVQPKVATCEDAVSREAVLDEISEWSAMGEDRFENAVRIIKERVMDLQHVQPQTADMDFQSGFNAGKSVGLYEAQTVDWDGMVKEIQKEIRQRKDMDGYGAAEAYGMTCALVIINKYRNGGQDE